MTGTASAAEALQALHILAAAVWTGSMAYSLTVVQPKVAGFFRDVGQRELFLATLANGNRWKVLGLAAGLLASGAGAVALTDRPAVRYGFGVALVLELVAVGVFREVSWRHWPARVFALAEEVPRFQRALLLRARTMTGLVGGSLVLTVAVSVIGR